MRIIDFTGMIPLAISTVVSGTAAESKTMKYNELAGNLIKIESESLLDHLNLAEMNSYGTLFNKMKFEKLYSQWLIDTMYLSSPSQIVNNEDFKNIVSMREDAIPFIIEKLEEKPSCLVWSLNYIFGFRISNNPSITIPEASRLWLRYLKS